jgi:hypothetical protein
VIRNKSRLFRAGGSPFVRDGSKPVIVFDKCGPAGNVANLCRRSILMPISSL